MTDPTLQKNEQFKRLGMRAAFAGVSVNLILVVGKLYAGVLSGSVSVLGDAVNNLSDFASSLITLIGFRVAYKPADQEHPFGHQRFEGISGLIIAFIMIVLGFDYLRQSVISILTPAPLSVSLLTLGVMCLSMLLKGLLVFLYRTWGRPMRSDALLAAAQDSRNDVLISGSILVALVIQQQTGWLVDGYVGVLMSIVILVGAIGLIRRFVSELVGEAPSAQLIHDARACLDSFDDILGFHDLNIYSYGSLHRFATVDIDLDASLSLKQAHQIIDRIEQTFKERFGIRLVTHVDPADRKDQQTLQRYHALQRIVGQLGPRFSFHDYSYADGKIHFDLVVPKGNTLSDQQLLQTISEALVQEGYADPVSVDFDRIYLLDMDDKE